VCVTVLLCPGVRPENGSFATQLSHQESGVPPVEYWNWGVIFPVWVAVPEFVTVTDNVRDRVPVMESAPIPTVAKGTRLTVAVTFRALFIETVQLFPLILSHPDHPASVLKVGLKFAVNVVDLSGLYEMIQEEAQVIAPSALVMIAFPLPAFVTVIVVATGIGSAVMREEELTIIVRLEVGFAGIALPTALQRVV
jgi:hypothetical protein